MTPFGATHFGAADLGHKKRTECLVKIADRIYRHPGGTLPHKLHAPKDYKAMDRLMNRAEVTHASVLEPHRAHTRERLRQQEDPVPVLHDPTELDYSGLKSLADRGSIGNGGGRGFLCHNRWAFAPRQHEVLGRANPIVHRRVRVGRKESVRGKRARADRERRLWLQGGAGVGAAPAGRPWVHVADRGADPFEFLAQQVAAERLLGVRSCTNRNICQGHDEMAPTGSLPTSARSLPLQGSREVIVSARPGRAERRATVRVAWAPVLLQPPQVRRGEYEKRPLPLWVVSVREVDPPAGVEPLEWIVLTNVPVTNCDEAWQRVSWYECRWVIEEFHKGQKTGCAIEERPCTTSQALEPLMALRSVVAVALRNVRAASRREDAKERPATDLVEATYVAVLSLWRYKGKRRDRSVHDFF